MLDQSYHPNCCLSDLYLFQDIVPLIPSDSKKLMLLFIEKEKIVYREDCLLTIRT